MADVTLPRWDLSDLFPSLESREYAAAAESLGAGLTRLVARYDELGIRATEQRRPTDADRAAVEEVLAATNEVLAAHRLLLAYVTSFTSTDSYDDAAGAAHSGLQRHEATLRQLSARLGAWVAALGAETLATAGPVAADHAFPLQRAAQRAEHQMEPGQEDLYAELTVTGWSAWTRLHNDLTSQLTAPVAGADGSVEDLPMAAVRGLATDPDPRVRRAAFQAEQTAWPAVATACAAAMNAIKGEAITVNARRGWADPMDASLFANAVDRETFEAMQAAVVTALPDFRRWMRAKAALHGHTGALPWWDLVAPLPVAPGSVTWDEGMSTVTRAFGAYAPSLAGLAERALRERWIDAEPRAGKRGGAFCGSVDGDRSMVFLNWSGSADSVQTLAHELGHAYHNTQLAGRTPLQRQLTMALAETASIFCETLVVEAGLESATPAERLALLDIDLQGTNQVVVDIHSRWLFETEVFRRRAGRTLGVAELCELMTDAQRQAYGDGIDQDTLHPYMWAVKPHYYGSHFYNWPYTYGLLFGLGLHAQYRRDPERFRQGYDDLLGAVGLADASELGRRFGIEVRDVAFWTASLDQVRERMAGYHALAAELVQPVAD
jgi:oligoendopeptidase F